MDDFVEALTISPAIYSSMSILFVHQNFFGQYLHLVRQLAAQPEKLIKSIGGIE